MDDRSLNMLVSSLKGPEYRVYKKKVRSTFDKIFEVLQEKSKFRLDRCKLVGGFGKRTSIGIKADADLVIFYNGKQDKKMVLENFQDVLVKCFASSLKRISTTRNMVMKLQLDDIPIDLVVAENNTNFQGDQVTSQRVNSIAKFKSKENAMTVADLGCALTESSVEFMKKQTKFVHDVVLLGKYWNHGILFKEYVYGRSLIMELLAAHAAIQRQENYSNPSITNAFIGFLEMVCNLQKQNVVFHETPVGYYKMSDIPKDILEQRPMLMDPVNPFNNLLDIRRNPTLKDLFNVFENAADTALKMIKSGCKDQKKIFLSQVI